MADSSSGSHAALESWVHLPEPTHRFHCLVLAPEAHFATMTRCKLGTDNCHDLPEYTGTNPVKRPRLARERSAVVQLRDQIQDSVDTWWWPKGRRKIHAGWRLWPNWHIDFAPDQMPSGSHWRQQRLQEFQPWRVAVRDNMADIEVASVNNHPERHFHTCQTLRWPVDRRPHFLARCDN
jgi:hypothetical protein